MIKTLISKSVSLVPWRLRIFVKRVPLLAPLQRWLLEKWLEGEEFVHTVDAGPARGLKYPIKLPQDKGVWTGTYELDFSTRLAATVKPGDVCLDIGGWRGFYGGVMALAGARQVYIFEPLPANGVTINELIKLNPNLPLKLFAAAVGETPGRIKFEVMPQRSMGKLTTSPFQQETHSGKHIEVDLLALDDLLAHGRIEPPVVIKMDIEGAEAFALRGARQLLTRHQPRLFIEIHSRNLARECAAILTECGYEVEVLETGRKPNFVDEPEVCHFATTPRKSTASPTPSRPALFNNNLDVPILLYHHLVAGDPVNPDWYEVSIRQFEQQLDIIKRGGFTTVSLHRLFRILRGEETAPPRMVVITFDDAFPSFLELGLPALQSRQMTATVFLPVGEMGGINRWDIPRGFPERAIMNAGEIRQIMAAGIEVGAHGWAHRNLTRCSEAEAREEIFRSGEEMRRCFGAAPEFYAYPYGKFSPELFPLLRDAGFEGAVTMFSNERAVTSNRFAIRRIYVHSGDNHLRFRIKLSPVYGRLMALRGTNDDKQA